VGAAVRGRKPATGEPLLDRAFRLLAAFRPGERSLSLTAMSARADIPKSSALRIARQLVDCGALERRDGAEFVIGLRLLEIASLAPRGHGLRQTALPFMEDLHAATRQHVLLAVRDGTEAVLVERLSTRGAGKVLYRVGGRMPLHATGVGLCLLANAPSEVQEQVLAGDLTLVPENRRLSESELRSRLAATRRTGVAVASRPTPSPMTSVAAPILGRSNDVIAALSVVTPSADVDPVALTPAVSAVCRSISRAMQAD
jgi:DNA-binding IclR family transcriptional regulator